MTTAPDRATEEITLRESAPPVRVWAKTYLIGIFMGTADGVPGVSGGTIALIAGIYERLIAAITAITPGLFVEGVRALTPLDGGISVDHALAVWEEIDGWFLLALVGGVGTAVIIVTQAVEYLDEHAPLLLFGFFFGLIAASALILIKAISVTRPDSAAAAVAGFLIAFIVSGLREMLAGGGLAIVFIAGAVAVSAMILPGISGSLLLVILNQYTRMTEALSDVLSGLSGLVSGGSTADILGPGREVVTFIVGGLVGVFTIARLIRYALDANREATLAFLVALVIGALRAPIATLSGPDYDVTWTTAEIGTFAAIAAVGAAVVLILEWYAVDIDLETV